MQAEAATPVTAKHEDEYARTSASRPPNLMGNTQVNDPNDDSDALLTQLGTNASNAKMETDVECETGPLPGVDPRQLPSAGLIASSHKPRPTAVKSASSTPTTPPG